MNSIVYSLFISLALRMTLVTAIVMAIKLLLRQKLSAAAHCAIWLIPCIQTAFCIGNVSIPSKTSIYNIVRDLPHTVPLGTAPPTETAAASGVDIRNVIALVYFLGAVLLFVWYVSVFLIHRHRIVSAENITDRDMLDTLADVKSRLGICSEIRLKRGKYAHTLSNMVIMPKNFSAAEEWQIILHELCHFKHKDNVKLWLAVFVICFNWFNPLIWLAFSRFRTDIEMYCDDSVIKYGTGRKEYAHMLVKSVVRHARFVPGIAGAATGKSEVAKRVKRIAAWKEKKPIWLIAAVFASVAISCMCLTDAVTIAVENTVDVAATPEPVDVVPAIADVIKSAEQPRATDAPAPAATGESPDFPEAEQGAAAQAPSTPAVYEISGSYEQSPVESSSTANDVVIFGTEDSEPAAANPPESISVTAEEPQTETAQQPEPAPTEEPSHAAPAAVTEVPDTVNGRNGELEDVSANGSKKTYSLDNGDVAVVHYNNGEPETGYIISGEETSEPAPAEN